MVGPDGLARSVVDSNGVFEDQGFEWKFYLCKLTECGRMILCVYCVLDRDGDT